MVLLDDTATLIGLFIAWIDIYLAHMLNMPVQDGVASVMIGAVLAFSVFTGAKPKVCWWVK